MFRFFEPALDAAARKHRELELELDLREALKTGQFRPNFQPIFNLELDRIGGFEALLRWRHPVHGNVPPIDFISVAEEARLVVAIGDWVMQEACRQATAHMETTAEGVEDHDQLTRLRGQGCTSIRGYLFSRPVECNAVMQLIDERMSAAA